MEYLAKSNGCEHLVGVARKSTDIDVLKRKFENDSKVTILQADVTDSDALFRVAEDVQGMGLVPDLLIYNAGILTEPRPFDKIPVEFLRDSMEVNVIGALTAMQAFLPMMRRVDGAVLVNVSSGWGLYGAAGQAAYCASKHGLEGLVKCIAEDVAADPLSVVTVRPGIVCTDLLATAMGSKQLAQSRGVPLEKFSGPFCEKLMSLTKADSGTHVDCSYRGP
jgi:3-oxoacyl-[acyl-carrier protein] reductase